MSKKQLRVAGITNELSGASLFFTKPRRDIPPTPQETPLEGPRMPEEAPDSERRPLVPPQPKPEEKRSKITRYNNTASMQASTLASNRDSLIEGLRKSVKSVGKEVSFVRLTPEEKARLFDIVYTYKRQGIKTSENEINRIAINYLIQDYEANGENSLLAQVITALNA